MKKLFVVDTNVVLFDHTCIYNFMEHDVALSIVVLEELDRFKRGNDLITRLRVAMRLDGVDIAPWPGGPASAAHTDADLDRTVGAFRSAVRMLKAEGAVTARA